MNDRSSQIELPPATSEILVEIAARFGTPSYAFDIRRIRQQVDKLRLHLPDQVELLYSFKANASLGICDVLEDCGVGAEVASAGELATAIEAGFSDQRIFVTGPFKSAETLSLLENLPAAVISVDSPGELEALSELAIPQAVVLRLRPDFGSCAVVEAGSESRFGFTAADLGRAAELLDSSPIELLGFHIFSGSQMLDTSALNDQLGRAMELALRSADRLGIQPSLINLGGGFGIPYGPTDEEIELAVLGEALARQVELASPARIVVELGRYLVAQSGWYLTSVLDQQTLQGRRAVVVDGGTHQRGDMCGLNLSTDAHPPHRLAAEQSPLEATDVLGCLSLPSDILARAAMLPTTVAGQVLAFANAGAYGVWSSPAAFHGSPLPAEVAFDGTSIQLMRERKPAQGILDGQRHVVSSGLAAHS
jgi:diaminopimelate decarboxylase